jgi:hypothetical protein
VPDETTTTTTTAADVTMQIEDLLETAFIALVDGLPYYVQTGYDVRGYSDNTAKEKQFYSVVHAKPVRRIAPNFPMWECEVELFCFSHIDADKKSEILRRLYNECNNLLNTLTPAQLSTASTLTIDGILPSTDPGAEDFNADTGYQIMTAKAKIYLTKQPVSNMTTTTTTTTAI